MMTRARYIDTVQAFLRVAELQSFTRAAEALTTQAAVSMKLQRLEVGRQALVAPAARGDLDRDGAVFSSMRAP